MLNILSLTDMDEKHGPAIWYRESTFMENPRVPLEVKASTQLEALSSRLQCDS